MEERTGLEISASDLRDNSLKDEEKQYLIAVERGDMATVRAFLEAAEVS